MLMMVVDEEQVLILKLLTRIFSGAHLNLA